jgi:hypothetical protein
MFTIELTRGSSRQEPVETIQCLECGTDSLEFAVAELAIGSGKSSKPSRRAA